MKLVGKDIDALKVEIMEALTSQGLTSFKGSTGMVSISSRWNVKFPKDETKAELEKYLRDKGVFDGMWSVNHQTLNAWYKAEMEASQGKGEYLDVPGLNPTEDKILSLRKK